MLTPKFTYESPDGKVSPVSSIGYAIYLANRDYQEAEVKGIIRCDLVDEFVYTITKDSQGSEVQKYFDENWGRGF